MFAAVAVAVVVVGTLSGPIVMRVCARTVMLVGMLTVAAVAPVAMGLYSRCVEAKNREDDHLGHNGDPLSAFSRM